MLPRYAPTIPTQVAKPFHRDGWVYEEKIDGWRIIAYKEGPRVQLLSRNDVDHATRFPELAAAVAGLRVQTLVLDGEVAIFDEQLRSRFELLRYRQPDVLATPPLLMAFDVLYHDGADVAARPLRERRVLLEDLVAGGERVFAVRRLASNGLEAWGQVLERGYEGYVAKDEASPYRGGVTRSWLKVKQPGWTDPEDRWRRQRIS